MGRAFGKYRVSRRLGVGATAEVFEATGDDGTPIVLKRILPQRASNPQFQELFEREARIVKDLDHPNVVALLDFGELEHSYYLALEKVDGGDLATLIQNAGLPGTDLSLLIGRELATALAYVHSQTGPEGVLVHRDVSPENVLLSRNGAVKLTDFGIACHGEGSSSDGKTPYLAPERASGTEAAGAPADVYALGAVLREMIGEGTSLEPLLRRTLAADAKERPTARELARELDEHLAQSLRPPTPEDLGRWVASAVEPEAQGGVDLLALHLLGDDAARPMTAVFATPQAEMNDADLVEAQTLVVPLKKPIRISLQAWILSMVATSLVSIAITKAVVTSPEAPPEKLIAVSPILLAPELEEVEPAEVEPEEVEPEEVEPEEVEPVAEIEAPAPPPKRPLQRRRPSDFGTLSVNSIPWANVFVDGELVGSTPLETTVRAGKHEIVLRSKSGKVIKEFTTEVGAGDRRVHSFDDGTR